MTVLLATLCGCLVLLAAAVLRVRWSPPLRKSAPPAELAPPAKPAKNSKPAQRKGICLRREVLGQDRRFLWASVDEEGAVAIEGQDLGPGTAPMSDDGEYEWGMTFAASEVPRLLELLGGRPGDQVLEVLARYRGHASYRLEELIQESDIPYKFWNWR